MKQRHHLLSLSVSLLNVAFLLEKRRLTSRGRENKKWEDCRDRKDRNQGAAADGEEEEAEEGPGRRRRNILPHM